MNKEEGERRDFLPHFFKGFLTLDVEVYLEKGYGNKLGHNESDYLTENINIKFVSQDELYKKDLIVVIRSPEVELINKMHPGSGLISMLHYETRPELKKLLKEREINAYSLDSIVNDFNTRLVVTYEMTALGGVHTAFSKMNENILNGEKNKEGPIKVTILGMGKLGIEAGLCAFRMYNQFKFQEKGVNGISIEFLDKEITSFSNAVTKILKDTDLLVDATRRPDPTKIIIPNQLINFLHKDAIILDLTADPYDTTNSKFQGKAIEGIPHGNLNKFIFDVDDVDDWNDDLIPVHVNKEHRRTTVSCNAWPGVMAKECMQVYGEKIWPFIKILILNAFILNENSDDSNERALYRSTISFFDENIN